LKEIGCGGCKKFELGGVEGANGKKKKKGSLSTKIEARIRNQRKNTSSGERGTSVTGNPRERKRTWCGKVISGLQKS